MGRYEDELNRLQRQRAETEHHQQRNELSLVHARQAVQRGDAEAVAGVAGHERQAALLNDTLAMLDDKIATVQRQMQAEQADWLARLADVAHQAQAELAAYEQTAADVAPVVRASIERMLAAYAALIDARRTFFTLIAESPLEAVNLIADLQRQGVDMTAVRVRWIGTGETRYDITYALPALGPHGDVLYEAVRRLAEAEAEAARGRANAHYFARKFG